MVAPTSCSPSSRWIRDQGPTTSRWETPVADAFGGSRQSRGQQLAPLDSSSSSSSEYRQLFPGTPRVKTMDDSSHPAVYVVFKMPRLHDTVTIRFGSPVANQPGAGSGAE